MKYAYEDLSDRQFEDLIILLCQRLFGISVQGFAEGPDGGRDAKFTGKAELHPSTADPWIGTTIIQAKHTNGYNRHFLECDFFSEKNKATIIGKEIPRIKNMRNEGQLNHYILFANRRLAGGADDTICAHISKQCAIPRSSIYLCGVEQLEIWLKTFPEVARRADIDPIDSPLIISPDDLAEIVQALARQKTEIQALMDDPPTIRVSFEEKNKLNKMTEGYAKAQRKRFLYSRA